MVIVMVFGNPMIVLAVSVSAHWRTRRQLLAPLRPTQPLITWFAPILGHLNNVAAPHSLALATQSRTGGPRAPVAKLTIDHRQIGIQQGVALSRVTKLVASISWLARLFSPRLERIGGTCCC